MIQEVSINLSNLLLSLSDALDLANPYLAMHQMRAAFIAWEIAKQLEISNEDLENLYIAALLHDIGALSPEEKINIHQFEIKDPDPHCIIGEAFLKRIPIFQKASRIVRYHHTSWTQMEHSNASSVVICSQILHLADMAERQIVRQKYILHQNKYIVEQISSVEDEFNPEIVEVFKKVAEREDFWLDIASPRLYSILLHSGPCRNTEINLDKLLSISEMFRNLIDFRSRFTATHTTGVAATAALIAQKFGLTDVEVRQMEIAGNFHDLGKLVVPNSILEKPGKLSEEEFALMKQHTYFTYTILTTIGGIQEITEWAAFHHERLDGSGYPFHLDASKLSTGARIMAVADIFTALAEDRPYRAGMKKDEILRILGQMSANGYIDSRFFSIVKDNFDEVVANEKVKETNSLHLYQEIQTNLPAAKQKLENSL